MARRINSKPGLRRHDVQMLDAGARLGERVVEPDDAECYFCDATGTQDSKEHLFPSWLQKELGGESEQFDPQYYGNRPPLFGVAPDEPTHIRPSMPARSLVGKNICRACNTGWMEALERRYRRFHFRREGWVDMDAVLWFIKTAFALNVSQNTRLRVPRDIRLKMASGNVSDRISVYFHVESDPEPSRGVFDFGQAGQMPLMTVVRGHTDEVLDSAHQLWACSIRVERLVGTVVLNPPGESWASSWEVRGAAGLVCGNAMPAIDWNSLPTIGHYSHGFCLVPVSTPWHNSFRSVVEIDDWPQGVVGSLNLRAHISDYAEALSIVKGKDVTRVRFDHQA